MLINEDRETRKWPEWSDILDRNHRIYGGSHNEIPLSYGEPGIDAQVRPSSQQYTGRFSRTRDEIGGATTDRYSTDLSHSSMPLFVQEVLGEASKTQAARSIGGIGNVI
jgi:hypothetical protein